MHMLMLSPKFR